MNINIKNTFNFILSKCQLIQFNFTRSKFVYFADRVKQPTRMGYIDKVSRRGLLPRLEDQKRIKFMPEYRPGNNWSESKALFGQNDYIDLLGGGKLHPVKIAYNVPYYLRGVSGNEFRLLLKKRGALAKTDYSYTFPRKWNELNKRIMHLYRRLNRKTKTGLSKNE